MIFMLYLYIYKRLSPTIGLLDKCEVDFDAKSFNYTSLFEINVITVQLYKSPWSQKLFNVKCRFDVILCSKQTIP